MTKRAILCQATLIGWLLASLVPDVSGQSEAGAIADQARRAMTERRFADAAELYGQLAARFPGEPTLLANLGMARHLSAQDQAAVDPLKQAAQAMPESFQAQFFLGASLTRLGRLGEAVDPLQTAVRLNRSHPFARALLGDALEASGRFREALEPWRGLQHLDETNPYAYAGLVRCQEQLAAQALESLRSLDPESSFLLQLLAESRMAAGQYPSAFYLYRQTLEREPESAASLEAIAKIYELTGRAEWAATQRRKLATLPALDCSSMSSTACDFRSGRYEAVLAASSGNDPEDLFWIARTYAKLAELSFAQLQALPESPEQLTLLAALLADQQQYSAAADACLRAHELRPGDGRLERQLAESLYLSRRLDEARPWLERFRQEDPGDPRWPAMLGNLLTEEQAFEQAVPLLEAAASLPGALPSVGLDLGRSYLALGQYEQAAKHLAAARTLDADGSVHYQLAQAYQRLGNRTGANEALAVYRALSARNLENVEAAAALEIEAPN